MLFAFKSQKSQLFPFLTNINEIKSTKVFSFKRMIVSTLIKMNSKMNIKYMIIVMVLLLLYTDGFPYERPYDYYGRPYGEYGGCKFY